MSKSVTKLWALLGVALITLMVSACGPNGSNVCVEQSDCEAGTTCFDGTCVPRSLDCADDADCGTTYQQCLSGQCVNNTVCEASSQCAPSQACDDTGACVTRQCSRTSDCPGSYLCDEGICRTTPRQCASVGEECVPDDPTRPGFACDDLGDGPRCYETCNEYRSCTQQGQVASTFDCGSGQACVLEPSLQDTPICRPSECAGISTAEADCAEEVAANPALFADGVHCGIENGVRTCLPAGSQQENESCELPSDCADGLACVVGVDGLTSQMTGEPVNNGYCARSCETDSECSGGQSCIGETDGELVGLGFCGDWCEPFGGDEQCGEGRVCVAVDEFDGLCTDNSSATRELYEFCSPGDTCPANSECVDFGPSIGDGMRCRPVCNANSSNSSLGDATCPSPDTNAYIQVAHFGADLPAVDIFVDGEAAIEGLTFSEIAGSEDFITLPSGERDVAVFTSGSNPVELFSATLDIEARSALLISAVADSTSATGLAVLTSSLTRDEEVTADQAKVRIAHGAMLGTDVDVVFTAAGDDVSEAANRIYALNSASFGEFGEYIELPEGDYDVYVFEPRAFDESDALATLSFTAVGGEISTEFIIDENDPMLISAPYASAPVGRILGGTCIRAFGGGTVVRQGVCLETCNTSESWGMGACTNPNDRCNEKADWFGSCFPGAGVALGASCSEDSDCVDGAHCDADGTGEGVCRSYCQPDEQTNDALGCSSGEICIASESNDNFGKCRLPCNPGADNTDPNCPVNQQGCYGPANQPYCQPTGDVAEGADCGSPGRQNCQAGLVCGRQVRELSDFLIEPFTPIPSDAPLGTTGGTCTQLCEPFQGDDSTCPDGFACSPVNRDGVSTTLGHCVERTEQRIRSLERCGVDDIGKMCDENSLCIDQTPNRCVETPEGLCVQLCDFYGGGGCTGGTSCEAWSDDGPLFELFGICR